MGGTATRLALAGGLTAVVMSVALAVVTGGLRAGAGERAQAGATVTLPPVATAVPAPGATVPVGSADVLAALDAGAPVPSRAGLQRTLSPLLAAAGLGSAVSMQVVDVATGGELLSVNPNSALVPASTAKVLTSAAVLSTVGPGTTLRTSVVSGSAPGVIVLVGGGDVLLGAGRSDPGWVVGRAGLADLADRTASALRAAGRTSVALRLDDTLFGGPAVSAAWQPGDVAAGYVAPVMALEVDAGRLAGRPGRQPDPAMSAARTFASLLVRRGIRVTGRVVRGSAPPSGTVLAAVQSAPVADQVEYALTESDNTVAEALARLVAVRTGRPATFAGAGQAVVDRVAALGVPTTGDRLLGGSGLADGSAVSAATLTALLTLAGSGDHPQLRAILSGLPVAGASGTLADRFGSATQRDGRGLIRAKTGTLKGVNALAGTVVDGDGRLLAFAILADRTGATELARTALDDVAVALAHCGCR